MVVKVNNSEVTFEKKSTEKNNYFRVKKFKWFKNRYLHILNHE